MQDWNVNLTTEKEYLRHIEMTAFHLFSFSLLLFCQGAPPPFSSRCSSLCCSLYGTSSFRLRHIEQRADFTYWIHKNNKPIKKNGYEQQHYNPRGDNSINIIPHLENNKCNSKENPCFRDPSLLHRVVVVPNLKVHTADAILCSHVVRREALKSNRLYFKLG